MRDDRKSAVLPVARQLQIRAGSPIRAHAPLRPPRNRSVQAPKGRLQTQSRNGSAGCSPSVPLEPRDRSVDPSPETALTGYFLEGGVRDHAVTAGDARPRSRRAYRAAAVRASSRSTSDRLLRDLGQQAPTTVRSTSRWARRRAGRSITCIARSSSRPTGCSTRSDSSSAASKSARSTRRGGARRCSSARTPGTRCRGPSPHSTARR